MKIVVFVQNRNFWGAKLIHFPMLYSVYKNYNNAEIILFLPYEDSSLFMESGIIKKVVFYKKGLFQLFLALKKEKPDLIISLRPEPLWLNLLLLLWGKKVIGFKNFFSFFYKKTIKYDKKIYRALAFNDLIDNNLSLESYFKNIKAKQGYKNFKKIIFIIPGGGSGEFKRWNIDNFIELCKKIYKEGFYFFFVLGEGEVSYIQKVENFLKYYPGEILFNKNLKDIISYFWVGDLFISNDCGPVHLAQMMGKRCLIIYSDEYENADKVIDEWFLPQKYSKFIKSENGKNINSIKVDDVFEKAVQLLHLS